MRTKRSSYDGTPSPLRAERERSASATEEPASPYVRAVESLPRAWRRRQTWSRSSGAGAPTSGSSGARLHVVEAAGARLQTLTTRGVPLQVLRLPGCLYPFGVCCHGADRVVVSDLHGGLHVLASRRRHL